MTDRVDSLGLWDAMLALPEQVEAAIDRGAEFKGLPDRSSIDNVLVLGMGDSGLGGEVAAACARPFSPVPIVVYRGYLPPSFVGPSTLVIAVSASGTTEETIEALESAIDAGAPLVAVTTGGPLHDLTEEAGGTVLAVPPGAPMPRAALGALAVPPMLALEAMGLFPGADQWLREAVDQLRRRRDELTSPRSPAADLARRIGRTIPIVYGGGAIGSTAAMRWKNGFNLNAKTPAFWAAMPELCHNELCGWGQHGDVTRQIFTQVNLRHDYEHPQTVRRFEFLDRVTLEVVHDILTVEASGDGPVAQLFDLILVGDLTSLELAAREGLDPGPLPVLDELKAWLDAGAG
jgi:glucose/mannose-6-phosphate isomerase